MASRCTNATRADMGPKCTRAAPFPNSSVTTPTRFSSEPLRTRTLAPIATTWGGLGERAVGENALARPRTMWDEENRGVVMQRRETSSTLYKVSSHGQETWGLFTLTRGLRSLTLSVALRATSPPLRSLRSLGENAEGTPRLSPRGGKVGIGGRTAGRVGEGGLTRRPDNLRIRRGRCRLG